jgi:hypothetical protein
MDRGRGSDCGDRTLRLCRNDTLGDVSAALGTCEVQHARRWWGIECTLRSGLRAVIRNGRRHLRLGLHSDDIGGSVGYGRRGIVHDQATEAALAAYPGGVIDRVVQLSSGEYEVHYIGVNWPHHIVVSTDFEVVGAD